MDNELPAQGEAREGLKSARIVWAALCAAVVVYGVIGLVVLPRIEGGLLSDAGWLLPVMCAFGVGSTALIFGLPRVLKLPNVLTRSLLQWTLAEQLAIVGFVANRLGASAPVFVGLLCGSLVLFLALFPTEASLDGSRPA